MYRPCEILHFSCSSESYLAESFNLGAIWLLHKRQCLEVWERFRERVFCQFCSAPSLPSKWNLGDNALGLSSPMCELGRENSALKHRNFFLH